MFSRAIIALALVASLIAPSVVADSSFDEFESLSARELQDVAAHFQRRAAIAELLESIEGEHTQFRILGREANPIGSIARGARVMTTRHCSGQNIMEKKTDETGKVISNKVYQTCAKPLT